jgi:hypothetical protein
MSVERRVVSVQLKPVRERKGRPIENISHAPGPGTYNLPSTFEEPKVTLKGRIPTKLKSDVPGPGQYDPKPIKSNLAFSLYGRIPRAESTSNTPGPGEYQLKSTIGDAKKFSLSPRIVQKDTSKSHMPGPGAYNIKSTIGEGKKILSLSSNRCYCSGE